MEAKAWTQITQSVMCQLVEVDGHREDVFKSFVRQHTLFLPVHHIYRSVVGFRVILSLITSVEERNVSLIL